MIVIKQVIHDQATNSVEATWINRIGQDANGNNIEVNVKCQSYADVQMDALESDLGADAATYAALIATVRAAIHQPTPAEIEAARIAAVPKIVSPRQIRQALTRAGLRTSVESAVAAGDQDIQDWWKFATSFDRHNSHVLAMAQALGVTDLQLDDLWTLAASL